jgi:hypothetical protein
MNSVDICTILFFLGLITVVIACIITAIVLRTAGKTPSYSNVSQLLEDTNPG